MIIPRVGPASPTPQLAHCADGLSGTTSPHTPHPPRVNGIVDVLALAADALGRQTRDAPFAFLRSAAGSAFGSAFGSAPECEQPSGGESRSAAMAERAMPQRSALSRVNEGEGDEGEGESEGAAAERAMPQRCALTPKSVGERYDVYEPTTSTGARAPPGGVCGAGHQRMPSGGSSGGGGVRPAACCLAQPAVSGATVSPASWVSRSDAFSMLAQSDGFSSARATDASPFESGTMLRSFSTSNLTTVAHSPLTPTPRPQLSTQPHGHKPHPHPNPDSSAETRALTLTLT